MANFLFSRFPNNYYYRYNNYYIPYNNYKYKKGNEIVNDSKLNTKTDPESLLSFENKQQTNGTKSENSSRYKSIGPISFKNPLLGGFDLEEPIIEILGIELYLDDIIILGLLFFLYSEGVKDDMLFLSLILLLLT